MKQLPVHKKKKSHTQKEKSLAIYNTIKKYPEFIKYYIKVKEEHKQQAKDISKEKVAEVIDVFVDKVSEFIDILSSETEFYKLSPQNNSYEEAHKRAIYLKEVIENNDGYRLFYVDHQPIRKEEDLQIIYRLTWYASDFDVNREVNNGRGPVDYTISKGNENKTLIEFKLASNSKLKQNLKKQVEIYEKANRTQSSIKIILYFNNVEYRKVIKILKEIKQDENPDIILIDASRKTSASNVK